MKVSVLTPSWNRGAYLERVWQGLNSQTYRDFEWIISNDGSTDDTQDIVRKLAAKSDFSILLINASIHIGKARMDNEAVAQARGEFILWNDSDDYLLPTAIESLITTWYSIPERDRKDFVGVTALCAAGNEMLTPLPQTIPLDITWNDLSEVYHVNGDLLFFTEASRLKKNPFPEVDFVIPEGVVWSTIGHGKTRLLKKVLKIVEYHSPNCISFSGKMEYSRGRAHAIAITERNLRLYPRSLAAYFWRLVTYLRYSLHGEISLCDQIRMWGDNSHAALLLLLWPVGYLFSLKDQLQNKVRRTHREFLAANLNVQISRIRLGVDSIG